MEIEKKSTIDFASILPTRWSHVENITYGFFYTLCIDKKFHPSNICYILDPKNVPQVGWNNSYIVNIDTDFNIDYVN